jgi:hypothetical protein
MSMKFSTKVSMFFAMLRYQPMQFLESFLVSLMYGNPKEVKVIFQDGASDEYIGHALAYTNFAFSPENMYSTTLGADTDMSSVLQLLQDSGVPMRDDAIEDVTNALNSINDGRIYVMVIQYRSRFLNRERVQFQLVGSTE